MRRRIFQLFHGQFSRRKQFGLDVRWVKNLGDLQVYSLYALEQIIREWVTCIAPVKPVAIGSICIFGQPGNWFISGLLIWRGTDRTIDLLPDLAEHRDEFENWKKVEREKVNDLVRKHFLLLPGELFVGNDILRTRIFLI